MTNTAIAMSLEISPRTGDSRRPTQMRKPNSRSTAAPLMTAIRLNP